MGYIGKDVSEEKGGHMSLRTIKIRLLNADDFDSVVGIDEKVLKRTRLEYYELKFDKLFRSQDFLPISLVAEKEDGTVVGFVLGELFMSEDGAFPEETTLDTIVVDPDYQHMGIGEQLMNEFIDHLRKVGVRKINTLVNPNDTQLMNFFLSNKFSPTKNISLARSL